MAKDKAKETSAAVDQDDRGELKQFKIYLPEKDIEKLISHSKKLGIGHNVKARLILIDYLDKLKD